MLNILQTASLNLSLKYWTRHIVGELSILLLINTFFQFCHLGYLVGIALIFRKSWGNVLSIVVDFLLLTRSTVLDTVNSQTQVELIHVLFTPKIAQ